MDKINMILLGLIQNGKAHTQQEMCAVLLDQGFEVNQTKISRLLHKLGAIKMKDSSGRLVYHMAQEHTPPQKNRLIAELIVEIQSNENLIVIISQPGSAGMIARLIDFHKKELEIIGVLAGDDTIFIAPHTLKKIPQILENLRDLLLQ